MNILIIEDDVILTNNLKRIFEKRVIINKIIIKNSYNGFLNEINIIPSYDIIIVDIILEHKNKKTWIDIIDIIRTKSNKIPIVVISWFSQIERIERAFDAWANDYIIKPFRLMELEVRVLKWFKVYLQSLNFTPSNTIRYRNLKYNLKENEFYYREEKICLTKKSKFILLIFLSSSEKLITERLLIEKIWWDMDLAVNRNLRICILRLKNSLNQLWIDEWIQNIRWEWYILKK